MSGVGLTFKQLVRSFHLKAWLCSAIAVASVALLSGAVALFSVLAEPGLPTPRSEIYAVPGATLSQAQLGALYRKLQADPDVQRVRFLFADPANGEPGRFRLNLEPGSNPEAVMDRLTGWNELEQLTQPAPPPPGSVDGWLSQPQNRRGFLAGLLLLVAVVPLAIYVGIAAARASFAGELEMLRLSGVDPVSLRAPFAVLGGLLGVSGALLIAVMGYVAASWLPAAAPHWLETAVPELLEPGAVLSLGIRTVLLGLLIGLAGAGLGWLVSRGHAYKYPKPLSRSRISASSASPPAASPSSSASGEEG